MALCIGATTSLFTVVRSVLLRPLPFRDPGSLVMLYEHFRDARSNREGFNYNVVAPADFYDWRAQTHGFEDMAAMRYWQFNLTGERGELPELVSARGGSWNLFPLLGVPAAIGRTFTESEDRSDGTAVMLTWNLFETAVRRRCFDCRQANPSRREALYGRWRASKVVHLSRCEGAALGPVCIGVADRMSCRIMTITSAPWWPA